MNCYLFGCNATKYAAIIDPGDDPESIKSAVQRRSAKVKMILLTHGHYDHLGAVAAMKQTYQCPILIHQMDAETLTNPVVNLSAFTGDAIVCPPADQILSDGDRIKLGDLTLEVLHTPGHSQGSVCFKHESLLFDGDVLFKGGIGRTDLPGGSFDELEASILSKIYTLPDDTVIFPGHGDPTNVGFEKKFNPFVRMS